MLGRFDTSWSKRDEGLADIAVCDDSGDLCRPLRI